MEMAKVEYWVMMVCDGWQERAMLVNGDWVIPVAVYNAKSPGQDDQNAAQESAIVFAQSEHARTGRTHKVTMVTE